ncbi:unnamed protein product [Arctia plantaginis]|uniref:Uncharacterized protein n=1 Tax=Arctia plantaginis TaxID=874455 RepID=A0A8S0ZVB8_ARCPL|nr:unnamed protein product [Arctia plantaginis]
MKRGRRGAVSLEHQKKVFLQYASAFKNNNYLHSNDHIFSKISEDLKFLMNPKSIYLSLKRHYDYFFDIEDDSVTKEDQEIIEEIETDDSSSNSDIKDEKLNNEYITFHLDIYSWEKIQPIVKVVKRSSSHFTSSN